MFKISKKKYLKFGYIYISPAPNNTEQRKIFHSIWR